ncbi:MAG TPA: hypothetical protein PLK77_00485 [Pyrinomonadaceae bacterium]|nr:hypothetical protein [Pyrinomonadaceae bacterium]
MRTPIIASVILLSLLGIARPQASPDSEKVGRSGLKTDSADDARKLREIAVQNLLVSARRYPVEVYADILLNLVDSEPTFTSQRKIELLEELFRDSQDAREAIKMRQLEGSVDTRSGYRAKAFALNLDRTSLRLRVIRKMLSLDKVRARQLFQEMSPMKIEPLKCENDLGYDIAEYYAVLKSIVQQTYDSEATLRREPAHFAASILGGLDSPAQVGPAIDFLAEVKVDRTDFEMILTPFLSALPKVAGDPRSFATAVKYDNLTQKVMLRLLPTLRDRGFSPVVGSKAYRTFFTKNVSSTQCRDSHIEGTTEKPHPLVEQLNLFVDPKIDPEELKADKIEPGQKVFHYWRRTKAKELLTAVKRLRFGDGTTELTVAFRSDQVWQQQFLKFLDRMDEWKAEDEESIEDYAHQKCVLFMTLFELAPPGQMQSDVLHQYSLLLRDSPLQKQEPAQWLNYVKMLISLGKRLKPEEQQPFIDRLVESGCEVCGSYKELEQLRQPHPPTRPGVPR